MRPAKAPPVVTLIEVRGTKHVLIKLVLRKHELFALSSC
jgi:hypothetical protein